MPDGPDVAAAAFQPIRANVHEVRKMVLAGSRVHGSRMRRTRRESDIPHRLVTNNRKVEISYPGSVCLEIRNQFTLLYLPTGRLSGTRSALGTGGHRVFNAAAGGR